MINFQDITINSYNKTAENYFDKVKNFPILQELSIFMDFIKPGGKILDLGCGPGHHAKIFVENGFSVVGIDLSSGMIKIAEREVPQADFFVMDIQNLDLQENEYDGIWASASLFHIPKLLLVDVLQLLKKYLQDSGVLYLSLKEGVGEEIIADSRYEGVEKFYAYYSEKEIQEILTNSGYKLLLKEFRPKRESYDTNSWIHVFSQKESPR
jgi:SAM-dependent methyltransferase